MSAPIDTCLIDAMYRTDFVSFVRKCFRTLMPSAVFEMNWHIQALAYELDQVRLGHNRRLIINLPPRSLKSIITSVAYPAFLLGLDPTLRIICVSYNAELAAKHANDFRVIMSSEWYQRLFPATRISSMKNTETEVVTTQHGFRLSTSVEGTLTGRGGDVVILDDPLKPTDALSKPKRERVNDFFFNTLLSRLDDKNTGRIVVVAQRLHADDLPGTLLRRSPEEWRLLSFPAIAEQEITVQTGIDKYHRCRVGDVLHPARESQAILDSVRAQLGPEIFAAQYQQNPSPPGDAMITPKWVQRYDQLPKRNSSSVFLQSWDTAIKKGGQNDYSVCSSWVYHDGFYYLVDVLRGRFDFPALKSLAISHAGTHKPDIILVEDTGIGSALVQELQDARLSAVGVKVAHNKQTRMSIQSAKFASGKVFFPREAAWLEDLETEIFSFPNGRHDDQVDSISQALAHEISTYGWNDKNLGTSSSFNWGPAIARYRGNR